MARTRSGSFSLRAILSAALLLALAALGFAQEAAPPDEYRLQPEDVIRIAVYQTNVNLPPIGGDVQVDKFGNISAPFAGTLKAEGKTTAELESELAARYVEKLRLRDPIVSVTVVRFRRVLASIGGGGVARPGQYEMRPGDTVLDLVSMGGGATPDRADLRRAKLQRANTQEVIPLDLYAMLYYGDLSQNFTVRDGDRLTIPEETRNQILALGAVARQGPIPYREPMRLADVVAQAGELRGRTKYSQTIVLRERAGLPGQYYRIIADFVRFIRKNDQTQNIAMQPGDIVYFSETNTPEFAQISSLANVAFILDRFGGLLGFRIFSR